MGRKFSCETTRKTNPDGELESVTVAWWEGTEFTVGRRIGGVFLLLLTLFLVGLAFSEHGRRFAVLPLSFAVMFGFAAVTVLRMGITRRSMVFGVDDSINTPNGIPRERGARRWGYPVSDIRSIEPAMEGDRQHPRYFVAMLMDGGEKFYVAGDIEEDHAVIIARRLTKAWGEAHAAQGGDTMWGAVRLR